MNFKIVFLAALGLLTPAFSALAGNGDEALAQCTDLLNQRDNPSPANDTKIKNYTSGYCMGLVSGVIQTDAFYEITGRQTAPFFCMPKGVTDGQGVRVFVEYLKKNPQQLHLPSGALVMIALTDAFPCSGQPATGR